MRLYKPKKPDEDFSRDRVFNIDIATCHAYGGSGKVIACIEGHIVINKILNFKYK